MQIEHVKKLPALYRERALPAALGRVTCGDNCPRLTVGAYPRDHSAAARADGKSRSVPLLAIHLQLHWRTPADTCFEATSKNSFLAVDLLLPGRDGVAGSVHRDLHVVRVLADGADPVSSTPARTRDKTRRRDTPAARTVAP